MAQYNPYFDAAGAASEGTGRRPRIRFSRIEVQHLLIAVVVLTFAFAFGILFWKSPGGDLQDIPEQTVDVVTNVPLLLASFGAMSSGFLLHELAHKVVAQRYGHWAEFRAQFLGLGLTMALAVFLKLVFAAPGAVLISGRVTPKENGLISLAGPATNLVIAAVTFPFGWTADADAAFPAVMATVSTVNALLAVFNLIPVPPLDGRKVARWNLPVYFVALAVAIGAVTACLVILQPFARWSG